MRPSTSTQRLHSQTIRLEKQMDALLHDPAEAEYLCPISKTLYSDPVVIASGQTFERSSIEKWFLQSSTPICPVSAQVCPTRMLFPNHTLKSLVASFKEAKCKKLERFFCEASIMEANFLGKHSHELIQLLRMWLHFSGDDYGMEQEDAPDYALGVSPPPAETRAAAKARKQAAQILAQMNEVQRGTEIHPHRMIFQAELLMRDTETYTAAKRVLDELDAVDLANDSRVRLSQKSPTSQQLGSSHSMAKQEQIFHIRRRAYTMLLKICEHQKLERSKFHVALNMGKLLAENLHSVQVEDYHPLEYCGIQCSWSEYCTYLEILEPVHWHLYGSTVEMFRFWNRMCDTYNEANRFADQLGIVNKMIAHRTRAFERDESFLVYMSIAFCSWTILSVRVVPSTSREDLMQNLQMSLHFNADNKVAKRLLESMERGERLKILSPQSEDELEFEHAVGIRSRNPALRLNLPSAHERVHPNIRSPTTPEEASP